MKNTKDQNQTQTSETIVIQVPNEANSQNVDVELKKSTTTETKLETTNQTSDKKEVAKTQEVKVQPTNEATKFETKSQQESKKFSGTLSYEDVLTQTQEISNLKKTELEYLAEESKMRREKIEGLDEHFKDLNAQPLSSVDSYSNYNLVLNKSIWNYNEVNQRNTKLQILDLALQTHIYMYDGVVIPLDRVEKVLNTFVYSVQANLAKGHSVVLNASLVLEALHFDKNKTIPIAIANPGLASPIGLVEWQTFVPVQGTDHQIIETFILLLDNALNNGHECEFFPETILVRNVAGVNSLFVSEAAASKFNSLSSHQK